MQYVDWNAILEELNAGGEEDFDVLAIPCNHFNLQEPGANEVIMGGLFSVRPGNGFVPNYTVSGKADINGASEIPLYSFLKVNIVFSKLDYTLLGSLIFFKLVARIQSSFFGTTESFLFFVNKSIMRLY